MKMTQEAIPIMARNSNLVNVSSMMSLMTLQKLTEEKYHKVMFAKSLEDCDDFMNNFVMCAKDGKLGNDSWPATAYGMSKLGLTRATMVLAESLKSDPRSILLVSCCPGYVNTDMSSHKGPLTIEQGALTPVYCAHLRDMNLQGRFFSNQHVANWDKDSTEKLVPAKPKSQMVKKAVLASSQKHVYENKPPKPISDTCKAWLQSLEGARQTFSSEKQFQFDERRSRVICGENSMPKDMESVLYWMNRDQRVHDNWAFIKAQQLGFEFRVPLHVCFLVNPVYVVNTARHMKFLLKGLRLIETECKEHKIGFHLLVANASKKRTNEGEMVDSPAKNIVDLVKELKVGTLITDFNPLREDMKLMNEIKNKLNGSVPMVQVDAHNVVPAWIASDKMEVGARTLRPKIHKLIPEFLSEFPPLVQHNPPAKQTKEIDWQKVTKGIESSWDSSVEELLWCEPGYERGMQTFFEFIDNGLVDFNEKRNDPTQPSLSNISPWLRFGHISGQRCAFEAAKQRKVSKNKDGADSFIEESVVRRELADNFCFYAPEYDNIKGAAKWAQETLNLHKKDERSPSYSERQIIEAETGDDLWNAAQRQLKQVGKMHGFLRMYWAKKILEWTAAGPEEAIRIALYLNDRYSIDGFCPNGFTGVMWSICGVHDQGWGERPIFGKIRFMNYQGCQRKFNIPAFIECYPPKTK
ncbi:hypothetical protein Ciccas_007822 [Cichlidogyrus casuarinus]|uniref:Deoxyribodipyrimidine photo-lyase n=1 Tax=Cichlidogyrus casuarinus TaxID=1844966 RepID=A0ABD2Q1T0_9PLAT